MKLRYEEITSLSTKCGIVKRRHFGPSKSGTWRVFYCRTREVAEGKMFSVPNINIKRACTRRGEISKLNLLTTFCHRLSCHLIALPQHLSPSLIEIIDFKTTLVPPALICLKIKFTAATMESKRLFAFVILCLVNNWKARF